MVLCVGWATAQIQHLRSFEWADHVAKLNQAGKISQCDIKLETLTPMMATTVPRMAPLNTSVAWWRLSVMRVIPEEMRRTDISKDRQSVREIYQYRPPTRNKAFASRMGINQYCDNSKLDEYRARWRGNALSCEIDWWRYGWLTAKKIKPQNADEACPDGNDWLEWEEHEVETILVIAFEMRNSSPQ